MLIKSKKIHEKTAHLNANALSFIVRKTRKYGAGNKSTIGFRILEITWAIRLILPYGKALPLFPVLQAIRVMAILFRFRSEFYTKEAFVSHVVP